LDFEKLSYEIQRLKNFIKAASGFDGEFESDMREASGIE